MPWLVMTAYLHSVMTQERKDMLKDWNLALVGMAFMLTLFGTFLTRSGVISSVWLRGSSSRMSGILTRHVEMSKDASAYIHIRRTVSWARSKDEPIRPRF